MSFARRFLGLLLLALLSAALLADVASGRDRAWDTEALQRIDPAELGYLTHATMLLDGSGEVLWQWGETDDVVRLFSVRKSLLSALYGVYVSQGIVDLNATLGELGIDDKEGLTQTEKTATVRDLLMARSGVYHPAAFETPRMVNQRPERGEYQPGEHWFYNNWDFNAVVTILEQEAGEPVGKLFEDSIAAPLGMQHFDVGNIEYVRADVSEHAAAIFTMSADDLGRLGLLMLNEGNWNGEQIIPAEWVRESTRTHSDLGMFGGYGYSWWSAVHGDHLPRLKIPDGTYSARGTGEQMVLVLPSLNAVWVHVTKVAGPDTEMMHITQTAELLQAIIDTHEDRDQFVDPRFSY